MMIGITDLSHCITCCATNSQPHLTGIGVMEKCCSSRFCQVKTHKLETRKENLSGLCPLPFSAEKETTWMSCSALTWLLNWFLILCVHRLYRVVLWTMAGFSAVGGVSWWHTQKNTGAAIQQKQLPKRCCYSVVSHGKCWSTQKNPFLDG